MGEPLATGSMTSETLKFLLADEHTSQEYLDAEPLTAEEMESVRELMPPWSISSELSDGGVGKVFTRSIAAINDEHGRKLDEFDEALDLGLIQAFGGYERVS